MRLARPSRHLASAGVSGDAVVTSRRVGGPAEAERFADAFHDEVRERTPTGETEHVPEETEAEVRVIGLRTDRRLELHVGELLVEAAGIDVRVRVVLVGAVEHVLAEARQT